MPTTAGWRGWTLPRPALLPTYSHSSRVVVFHRTSTCCARRAVPTHLPTVCAFPLPHYPSYLFPLPPFPVPLICGRRAPTATDNTNQRAVLPLPYARTLLCSAFNFIPLFFMPFIRCCGHCFFRHISRGTTHTFTPHTYHHLYPHFSPFHSPLPLHCIFVAVVWLDVPFHARGNAGCSLYRA